MNVLLSVLLTVTLGHQGRLRQYVLYVPDGADGSLVLVFHGGGQSAAQAREFTGFDALADRHHFIVAYPEAFEGSWADGRGATSAEQQRVDDVGFAEAIVNDIAKTYAVNRSRVFATGLSNGGIFANRLGCEAAGTFAAIAPVVASIATATAESCRPSAPVAIIGIQSVDDPSVHFDGGTAGDDGKGGRLLGSRAAQELWRVQNGCSNDVVTTPLPVNVRDGTSVNRRAYSRCRADVVWYEIQGGGHRWPPHREAGAREDVALRENGTSSQNIDASEVIWQFFAAHPRR
jgi:polyhydroxybutyrate depolymerase